MSEQTEPAAPPVRATLEEMRQRAERAEGRPVAVAMTHGTMIAKLYAPRGVDLQEPHEQDEVYVVMRGSGTFVHGDRRDPFGPGDLLFVEAAVPHRFEEFTDDLALWVVFYGPAGGERS